MLHSFARARASQALKTPSKSLSKTLASSLSIYKYAIRSSLPRNLLNSASKPSMSTSARWAARSTSHHTDAIRKGCSSHALSNKEKGLFSVLHRSITTVSQSSSGNPSINVFVLPKGGISRRALKRFISKVRQRELRGLGKAKTKDKSATGKRDLVIYRSPDNKRVRSMVWVAAAGMVFWPLLSAYVYNYHLFDEDGNALVPWYLSGGMFLTSLVVAFGLFMTVRMYNGRYVTQLNLLKDGQTVQFTRHNFWGKDVTVTTDIEKFQRIDHLARQRFFKSTANQFITVQTAPDGRMYILDKSGSFPNPVEWRMVGKGLRVDDRRKAHFIRSEKELEKRGFYAKSG